MDWSLIQIVLPDLIYTGKCHYIGHIVNAHTSSRETRLQYFKKLRVGCLGISIDWLFNW